jgi:hypothetical protein
MDLIAHYVETYGLIVVAVLVGLESVCLPVPGETVLILAAILAGTKHDLDIVAIVLTASAAAILGQTLGYLIGRQFGYRLLVNYGGYLRITEGRIKLGEYLVRPGRWRDAMRVCCGINSNSSMRPAAISGFRISTAITRRTLAQYMGLPAMPLP